MKNEASAARRARLEAANRLIRHIHRTAENAQPAAAATKKVIHRAIKPAQVKVVTA